MDSATLANDALKFTPLERARIIDALWSSLDPGEPDAIGQPALHEPQDRLAAFRTGQLTAMNGEEALRAIEAELTTHINHRATHKSQTATGLSASATEKVSIVDTSMTAAMLDENPEPIR